jgi:hypothetical protein
VNGGWADTRHERVSAPTLQRLADAEAQQARADAVAARERELAAEAWRSSQEAASIVLAAERGEPLDLRQALAQGGVGRTRAEALAYYSAVQDAEDAQVAARQAAEFRRWQQAQQADNSADTTVPAARQLTERQREALAAGDRAVHDQELLARAERRSMRWTGVLSRRLRDEGVIV